ncbi:MULTISPECIES: dihydroorotase family protein [unclassified Mesorhizobium]|uniref:dihydroorotase n=3 Tax=Mesorhizobium TaxID=68287 RepID=UPI000BAFB95F|nr:MULTISPECIES: dihydroorotase family protein [unclassified Mesorhizobium]PBB29901.1 dihydroorotase [Mesorhizobium sp. WSM3882]RUV06958.1 dihydroorotase [Mesorhizobium sp. M1A.F.Ca.IN.020.03.2.1]RUV89926.1 dihydroorotase [Mesorhizobium sp. M1A.F.Ca.IN.020.32.1.1]RUW15201.1 dihydroorotase [Mesorhizobium sp. M1A.F.Ca.IN.022.05.2.1]RWF82692.1 MAG: dihydroorotase [Mesorhizobium sp.]
MFETLIRGATIVNADSEARRDIAINAGRIAALIQPGDAAEARKVIDASGYLLLPGLVDAHAHLREPGLTHKEDFSSGTHAAALGGVTTVLDMPTDEPWTATADQLAEKTSMAEGKLNVDVGFQAVVSERLDSLEGLAALAPVSIELFTADVPEPFLFPTVDTVLHALKRMSSIKTIVGISPGDQSLLVGSAGRVHACDIAAFRESRPPLAEANGIARALLAAAETGARVHVRQINSALGVETWRRLRDLADASVETTPQNLFFCADDYEKQGARLKGSPPFRPRQDVQRLREAVAAGLIDIIATDHAPHSPAEKAASYPAFADIPGGMPGLQTLLSVMLKLVDEGLIGLRDIARLCAANPAERFGLGRRKGRLAVGHDADILIIDPTRTFAIRDADQKSKAGYTPFDGWSVSATLRQVFLRGEEITRDGALVNPGQGQVVRWES